MQVFGFSKLHLLLILGPPLVHTIEQNLTHHPAMIITISKKKKRKRNEGAIIVKKKKNESKNEGSIIRNEQMIREKKNGGELFLKGITSTKKMI